MDPLLWEGPQLAALEFPNDLLLPSGCVLPSCESVFFEIAVPEGHWDAHPGALEIALQWDFTLDAELAFAVYDAAGNLVASGIKPPYLSEFRAVAERSVSYGAVALIEEPPSGRFEVRASAVYGSAPYRGALQIEPVKSAEDSHAPARDLLPNLRILPPAELRIESPGDEANTAAAEALGVEGCFLEEALEHGARRCLRFSSVVGNLGEGSFEARLPTAESGTSVVGQGQAFQRIYRSDDRFRDEPIGPAEFHAAHHHYHLLGVATHTLYAYKLDARERGENVTGSHKVGFCIVDMGLLPLGTLGGPDLPRYGPLGCFGPSDGEAYVLGLSTGWWDLYWWSLPDQYVEISSLENGVYELVSVVNAERTFKESNATDNASSVVFRLDGNSIQVLATSEP